MSDITIPIEWTPINPPVPQDEGIYDICLHSGEVIEEVEFWVFGGGFGPPARRQDPLVAYPLKEVRSFKVH